MNKFTLFSSVSIVDFENVFVCWASANSRRNIPLRISKAKQTCSYKKTLIKLALRNQ